MNKTIRLLFYTIQYKIIYSMIVKEKWKNVKDERKGKKNKIISKKSKWNESLIQIILTTKSHIMIIIVFQLIHFECMCIYRRLPRSHCVLEALWLRSGRAIVKCSLVNSTKSNDFKDICIWYVRIRYNHKFSDFSDSFTFHLWYDSD